MKNQKKGDATGRANPRSPFLAHPGAKFFCRKRGLGTRLEPDPCAGTLGESFFFCFSSLAGGIAAAHSSQGARRFLARRERTP